MASPSSMRRLAIVVGGGPAPGINGVIASVTLEALRLGWKVTGCQDGFKHLVTGSTEFTRELTEAEVTTYALRGGSMLGTARTAPTKNPEHMQQVLRVLTEKLQITDFVTIGGDDTAYTSSQVKAAVGEQIRVAHVPKTIDNDLPLPGTTPTFGYETARHHGTLTTRAMIEDAKTTSRWYIVVSMGRAAGHLALGIGQASAAPLTLIPEELTKHTASLEGVCDLITGSILKRKVQGLHHGVAVLAEGLIERIGVESLDKSLGSRANVEKYGKVVKDEHGNWRFGEIAFGRMVIDFLNPRLAALGLDATLVPKDVGYELRCVDPVPFDCEYTRELGYAAVRFLCSEDATRYGAIMSVVGGNSSPLKFEDHLDAETHKMKTRQVNTGSLAYQGARRFMDRLEAGDFEDAARLSALAKLTKLDGEGFQQRFRPLV